MAIHHNQDLLAGAGPDPAHLDHESAPLVDRNAEAGHHLQDIQQIARPHVSDFVSIDDGCYGRCLA